MEQYEIRIFPTAKQDLLDVIDYLNTLSRDSALKCYDRLVSEIASLSTMPERCPRPRDLALAAKGYRYLVVGNYLLFYVVAGNTVQIRRILYARRDYKKLL
ncbi:MAG: type II toxin-antitoxin system RelE/ParE family toxin [Oscillospiraceae bacterium]|nr:type II toxin-antitoxin system RelE/ParE family toxin [Oscillospiraceae bacterium]